jgi:hypothetical protein
MPKSVSILLGAGFSAPQGYPIGNELNKKIENCSINDFSFHSSGTLVITTDGKKPDFGYKTSYDIEFEFCLELIKYYKEKNGDFDYEMFYDYLKDNPAKDPEVIRIAEKLEGKSQISRTPFQLVKALDNIYNQIIGYYLVDSSEKGWYDDESWVAKPIFPNYTGILNYIEELKKDYIVNIHTLNHDLFFERLNMTDWLSGDLSDGFEELGSPFYGDLRVNDRTYKVRLSRYTGKYNNKIHFYKLHGSRDYCVFYRSENSHLIPETYIKTRYGIGFSNIYKEFTDGENNLKYDDCWINYHSDFLTGSTSKIERYKEPLLYKKLFTYFKQNLTEAEQLIIIGYGCKDLEINKIIIENFNYKNKQSIIIDPFPNIRINELSKKINSKIITSDLQTINI